MSSSILINKLSKRAFWDVEMESINWDDHRAFILERIMQYGTMDDWKIIRKVLDLKDLKHAATQANDLDDFSLSFLSLFLKIPREQFRCYIKKQSKTPFWTY